MGSTDDLPPNDLAAMACAAPSPEEEQELYGNLVRLARAELARHRRGGSLDTRGLVHEAYCKLAGTQAFANRAHFFSTAARAMRQVVIDYARRRLAACRGEGAEHVPLSALETGQLGIDAQAERLVQVDEALQRMALLDPRLVKVIELRFFSGLEVEEIAELLGVSTATIKRDTRAAKAFLDSALA